MTTSHYMIQTFAGGKFFRWTVIITYIITPLENCCSCSCRCWHRRSMSHTSKNITGLHHFNGGVVDTSCRLQLIAMKATLILDRHMLRSFCSSCSSSSCPASFTEHVHLLVRRTIHITSVGQRMITERKRKRSTQQVRELKRKKNKKGKKIYSNEKAFYQVGLKPVCLWF